MPVVLLRPARRPLDRVLPFAGLTTSAAISEKQTTAETTLRAVHVVGTYCSSTVHTHVRRHHDQVRNTDRKSRDDGWRFNGKMLLAEQYVF